MFNTGYPQIVSEKNHFFKLKFLNSMNKLPNGVIFNKKSILGCRTPCRKYINFWVAELCTLKSAKDVK